MANQKLEDLNIDLTGSAAPPVGSWTIDTAHTSVDFVAKHLVFAKVRGSFREFSGALQVDEAGKVQASGTIDPASITTNQQMRDDHLRSGDFLETQVHPTIDFASTSIEHVDGSDWKVTGDLTIKGVTRSITLDVELLGIYQGTKGETRAAFTASGEIDRFDFGLTWNAVIETGAAVVGKKVTIGVEGQAILQQ
jgi:polyisoprenoid-binding protein YceI